MSRRMMKAALYGGVGKVELGEVELPSVPRGFVLVDTKVTGICGSDLHRYFGGWSQTKFASGHEISGVVAELGEGVDIVKVGDRVCAECFSHCGQCRFCELGLYNLCENRIYVSGKDAVGFAEYSLLHSSSLFTLPQGFDFEQGALVEPLSVSYRAFWRSGSDYKSSVAVIGGGTIGLLCLAVAKAAGVPEKAILVKYDHQARMAEKLGADHVLRASDQDIGGIASSFTDGLGFDVAIDTVASAKSLQDTLEIVRRGGTVVLVGGYTKAVEAPLKFAVDNELNIRGSICYGYTGSRKDFEASIGLIASGRVDAAAIVTHKFPLENVAEAFRTAGDKTSGSIKVLVIQ